MDQNTHSFIHKQVANCAAKFANDWRIIVVQSKTNRDYFTTAIQNIHTGTGIVIRNGHEFSEFGFDELKESFDIIYSESKTMIEYFTESEKFEPVIIDKNGREQTTAKHWTVDDYDAGCDCSNCKSYRDQEGRS